MQCSNKDQKRKGERQKDFRNRNQKSKAGISNYKKYLNYIEQAVIFKEQMTNKLFNN